jgi:hypothetical protein
VNILTSLVMALARPLIKLAIDLLIRLPINLLLAAFGIRIRV